MNNFLCDHTIKYEYISVSKLDFGIANPNRIMFLVLKTNDGKYLVWKLLFPRIGDTFVTIDKLLQLIEWQQIYETMQRLTAEFDKHTSPVDLIIGRFKIQIQNMINQLEVQHFQRVGVDANLLHSNIMSLSFSLGPQCKQFEMVDECKNYSKYGALASMGQENEKRVSTIATEAVQNVAKKPRNESTITSSIESFHSPSYEESHCNDTLPNDRDTVIPDSLEQLRELMKKEIYLRRFGFEDYVNGDSNFRLYDNVYTTKNGMTYASFHSTRVIRHFKGGSCQLFFCYSDEMLSQLYRLKFKLEGVAHVLVVFVNMVFDRITPFGVFLLPNKDETVLYDVMKNIDGWLCEDESKCRTVIDTCTAPCDISLHRSIIKVWPSIEITGCSAEFQKDLKRFHKEAGGRHNGEKIEATSLAKLLCFLPKHHILTGIDVIKRCCSNYYGIELAQYIINKWVPLSISVYDKAIHRRSLLICRHFFKIMEITYFKDSNKCLSEYNNIYDFIGFLKTLFSIEEQSMYDPPKRSFGYNTELQIQKEKELRDAMNNFKNNEEPVTDYLNTLKFLLK